MEAMSIEVYAIKVENTSEVAAANGYDWSHRDDEIIDALRDQTSNSLQMTPIRECEEEFVDNFMLCMEEPEEVLRSSHSDISGITSNDARTLSGQIDVGISPDEFFYAGKESDDSNSSMHDQHHLHPLQFVPPYHHSDDDDDELTELEDDNLEKTLDEYNYSQQGQAYDSVVMSYGSTEEQLEALMESLTDPVGKYMRRRKLSSQEAIEIGVDRLLLKAPRKIREKYGPRRHLTQKQRDEQLKERNRCHAKATRMRRRLFRLVDARVDKFRSATKVFKTPEMEKCRAPKKQRRQPQEEEQQQVVGEVESE